MQVVSSIKVQKSTLKMKACLRLIPFVLDKSKMESCNSVFKKLFGCQVVHDTLDVTLPSDKALIR